MTMSVAHEGAALALILRDCAGCAVADAMSWGRGGREGGQSLPGRVQGAVGWSTASARA